MNVNEQARFEQMAERNQYLASRADNPDIRKVHEAWATFYRKLAAHAVG